MASLEGKTVFITGASRGIGKAIGLRAARDGANVAIIAKTAKPHPSLPGTIYTAADEMAAAGGRPLPLEVDIRFEDQVDDAAKKCADEFGGIDIVVNNASAIFLAGTLETPMKRFDLMHAVNVRGTYVTSQACLPYLLKSSNGHVLNLSPPLNFEARWFAPNLAYSLAKFGMSLCVLGMAEEFRGQVAVNALWPKSTIATAAVQNLLGGDEMIKCSRTPDIMGDAAHAILTKDKNDCTGNYFVDEDLLRNEGVDDFEKYAVSPGSELMPDFFL